MLDASTWSAIFTGLKSIGDVINLFSDKTIQREANQKIIEIQRLIAETQIEHLALIQIKGEMEEKLREKEEWDETAKRYQLTQTGSGQLVYVPKPNGNPSEPPHWCCTNCWKDKKKSILQRPFNDNRHECPQCKYMFKI